MIFGYKLDFSDYLLILKTFWRHYEVLWLINWLTDWLNNHLTDLFVTAIATLYLNQVSNCCQFLWYRIVSQSGYHQRCLLLWSLYRFFYPSHEIVCVFKCMLAWLLTMHTLEAEVVEIYAQDNVLWNWYFRLVHCQCLMLSITARSRRYILLLILH